jgi:hypothetical protein
MTDIELNPFNLKQRKLLQFGVVLILALFLVGYFLLTKKTPENKLKNNTVYLENSTLQVFDDTYSLSQYPDKVLMHYPYLMVVKPSQQISYIYNLQTKSKEKDIKQSLLDYDGKNILYNNGKNTFINQEGLGLLCDLGFVKNANEVLCVTKVDPNFAENKLVSVDVLSKKQKDVYTSKNLITAISIFNNMTYLGVNDFYTHKNYLLIDKDQIEFPDIASLIYEMGTKPYIASLKSAFNNNTESYYLIVGGKAGKQEGREILLYK